MKYIKSYKDFTLNEAFSKSIKDRLTIKFKSENPDLTDNQIIYYIDEFDKMKGSTKVIEKDILKYSFIELEKLIDSFPKKVNKSEIGLNNLSQEDVVYDENNLLILKGDTKEKCIKYGRGYKWCISRTDSSNMFNSYRYRYDEINFYFIFDKDRTDDYRSLVLLIDKQGTYYLANALNSGDFAGTKEFSYEQICSFQPKIKELKNLFKPLPLTIKEREIHNKIKDRLKEDNLLEYFGSYEILEAYISYGHKLSDNQYTNLTDDLKSKYINLGHQLSDKQLSVTSNKLIERYDNLRSLETWLDSKYSKEEQAELTELYYSNNLRNLKGIEKLTNLTYLDCSGNELTSLKGIENLTKLIILDCENNNLTSLTGIEKLNKLTKLDCSENNLESLNGIENLTKLTNLNCSENKLTSLNGIENLTKLYILKCSFNNLTSLKGIENLTKLTTLYCYKNSLTSLKTVEKLTKLNDIKCDNNPIDYNTSEILRKIKNGESIE